MKRKLRTSQDLYSRILWDGSFDSDNITIGYEDRFIGIVEVQFQQFYGFRGETIPYHRIRYFKNGDTVIWDREKRIDLVFKKTRV